jgi:general secretion pathway protein D
MTFEKRGDRVKKSLFVLSLACFLSFVAAAGSMSHAAPANGAVNGGVRNGNGANGNGEHDEKNLVEAAKAMRASGMVQFNFTDLELVKFVRFVSELTQRTIVVPPNVAGKITVISPKPSTLNEARQIFISILQSQGWTLQNMGDYDKLVQGMAPPTPGVTRGKGGPGQGEEVVTHIVPLRYIVADFVIQAMQQAFGQTVLVLPVGNGRDILLQGRATDVNRGVRVIRDLDVESSAKISRVFLLHYADPSMVANQLNSIAQMGTHLRGLTAVPDPNSRQVVVLGEPHVIADAIKIIDQLDVDRQQGEFHIYKLKNIDAAEAAEQIGKVLAASHMVQANQNGQHPATVVPDLTTNSLIFAATQRQYDSLVKILDTIDIQPKQVLIRGFMAEVNVTNLDKAGIDWSILGGQIWDNFMLGGMGQLGEAGIPAQFAQYFDNLSRREVPGYYVDNQYMPATINYEPLALLYATVDMLKKYDAVNVLSVPRLMCTDNKESSFQVGQNIPVLKGTASDLSNPGAMQHNYDYKDTGLTLTVTPRIRSGNVVALDIEQTTEDVLTAMGSITPVTAKRKVKTSVVVEDGETIILGGMVKETEKSLRRRVPGLSYIPLLGNLFQKVSKEREKVDFIIFLTPQIIGNTDQMRRATAQASLIPGDSGQLRVEMSPAEAEVDTRFREMYKQSLKKKQ